MVSHAVAAALLDAGGEGERQGVEDEVGGLEAVALDGEVVDLRGDPELPARRQRAWPCSSMQVQTTAAPYVAGER